MRKIRSCSVCASSGRALNEEPAESVLEPAQQIADKSLVLGEPPVGVRGANAVDEKVLGEQLAGVHRSLTLED